MQDAFICDAIRTPIGRYGGSLATVRTDDLGAIPLRALQDRNPEVDWQQVDDIYYGCANQAGEDNRNVARMASLLAGLPVTVPGATINRLCGSGLDALGTAGRAIKSGEAHLAIAGGVESMSRVPMGSNGGALGGDPEFSAKTGFVPQGIGADTIATLGGWSREQVDSFALESQRRAAHARDNGYFDRSVVPVVDDNGLTILAKDDFIKPDTTMEKLGFLNPSFEMMGQFGFDDVILRKYTSLDKVNHVHTPGNSSGIVDGSSAVLIGSEKAGKDLGMTPRGRIVATAVLATEPTIMLTGPGPAAEKCLKRAGMSKSDIDLWEINEAFASVAMRYMADLDIDHEITNVNGGAIAMGHPLGATGAMLVSIVLDELERRDLRRGMLSLCVGGGMGISTIIERV